MVNLPNWFNRLLIPGAVGAIDDVSVLRVIMYRLWFIPGVIHQVAKPLGPNLEIRPASQRDFSQVVEVALAKGARMGCTHMLAAGARPLAF